MILLDGKKLSQIIRGELLHKSRTLMAELGRPPVLAVMIVGDHGPSQVYVRNKIKACAEAGIRSLHIELKIDISEKAFLAELERVSQDPGVDGLLVQLPLPKQLQHLDLGRLIPARVDADGFTYQNLGLVAAGRSNEAAVSCTPKGVMSLLRHHGISCEGKHAVVVGRSLIVGRPMSWLLTEAGATVTVCHSKTKNLREFTKSADIVVVAAGKSRMLGREDFKQGAVVVDVGIHGSGSGTGITGDVRFDELEGWASAATPVPGGVGPMTITSLLENTLWLAERRGKSGRGNS